jgi:hypothetical protein
MFISFFSHIMTKNIHKAIRRRLPSYSSSLSLHSLLSVHKSISSLETHTTIYILYTPYRSLTHTLHIHIIDVNPFTEPAGFVEYRYVVMNVYYLKYIDIFILFYFILEKKLIRQIFNPTK